MKKDLMKVITISSGKGGVGKTNVVANLACALARLGKEVVVLDADLGLGNLDVLLGLTAQYNFGHVVRGEKTMSEIMIKGPHGIRIIPAASGVQELTSLTTEQKMNLFSQLEYLDGKIDVMLIDNGAGISQNVLFFNLVAGEKIVVATPEPTSIIDAYALMKVLHLRHGEKGFKLLVNQARTDREGIEVYKNITAVADRYLNISIDYLGAIPYDENVPKAVREQRAILECQPNSPASKGFKLLAETVVKLPPSELKDNVQFFMGSAMKASATREMA
jgi:flagellar biosynthesis protein FlhG